MLVIGVSRLRAAWSKVQFPLWVIYFSLNLLDWLWDPCSFHFTGYWGFFPRWKVVGHLRLVPRLRMKGAVPLLSLFAFMTCSRKTLCL